MIRRQRMERRHRFGAMFVVLPLVLVAVALVSASSRVAPAGKAAATAGDPVIAAAGDISCDPLNSNFNGGNGSSAACREKYTSDLLVNAGLSGVLLLGDNQYECGSLAAYQRSFDPSWGRVKAIIHPSLGNHEYITSASGSTGCDSTNTGAAGFFNYFGAAGSGVSGKGYYSYDIGTWHLIAMNSQCGPGGGCSVGSQQETWLKADLAAHKNYCTLAYWHVPLFSSGGRAASGSQPWWQDLYDADADVILTGHDHIYERFAPMNPQGAVDSARGIRQFIVGTGGNNHTSIATVAANSVVRDTTTFGVLKMTLHPQSYDWQFVPDSGSGSFTDSGSAPCHGVVTDTTPPSQPTNLTATPKSPTQIDLAWTASTDNDRVAGYKVYRDTVLVAQTSATTYSDTGLAPNSSHSYQIVAYDPANNSSTPSSTVTAKTPADTTAPSQPTNVVANAAGANEVDVTWTASTDNVGVDHYSVTRSPGGLVGTPSTPSLSDTTVQPSSTYSYTVIAVDASGNVSPVSAAASATTPAPPTTLTFSPTEDTYVEDDVPTTNFGSSSSINIDGSPLMRLFVKFNVSGLNGRKVLKAVLRMTVNSDGSVFGGEFHTTSTSWSEGTMTWNTQPVMDAAIVGSLGAASPNTTYDIDVTPAVTKDGLVAIAGMSTNADGVHYFSKEAGGTTVPQLIVTASPTPADTTPPSQPTGLHTTAVTDSSVTLAWNASTDNVGVDHYEITRDGTALPNTAGLGITDNGRAPSTLYHYTVLAVDAAGNKSTAAALDVTTSADATKPSVPTGLVVLSATYAQVQLSWTASTDNVAVTKYRVYRNGTMIAQPATTGYTDTTVAGSTPYTYTVSAVDAAGNESAQSSGASVTTPPAPDTAPPTQPSNVRTTALTDTSLTLAWDASTDNVGVDHYEITRDGTALPNTTGLTVVDNGRLPNTTYHYAVVAADAAGNKSPAGLLTVTTPPDTNKPTVPTGLTKTSATYAQVQLSWTASTDDIAVTKYRVYRDGTQVGESTTTSYTDGTVAGSTTYTYTVSALDAAGNESDQSVGLSVTTPPAPDTAPPTQPANVRTTALTDISLTLAWDASTDNVGVDHYEITRDGTPLPNTTGLSLVDNGRVPNTTYHYAVVAADAAGNKSPAGLLTVTTPPDTNKPTVPTGLAATSVTYAQVQLSWTASTDDIGVTKYRIYRGGTPLGESTATAYTDSTVAGSTPYTYTVSAVDAAGNESAQSAGLPVTTPAAPDTSPPTQPTGLVVTSVTESTVSLSWIASADNVGVDHYDVTRTGGPTQSVAATVFADGGLVPSTLYSYSVVAVDAAGNRSAAAVIDATTSAATTLTFAPTDDTYVQVDQPTVNFGSADQINIDGSPVMRLFTKFNVTGLNGRKVLKAVLRLSVNNDGSVFGGEFHTTSTSWSESSLTWDTQPVMDPAIVGTLGAATPNTTYDIDVTPAVTKDGLVAIEGVSTDSDGVHYFSKEGGAPTAPQLIVSTTSAPADTTPPTQPTNLVTTAVTATSVTLSWTASTDNVGVDHYEVTRDGTALPSAAGTTITDAGRSPSTLYHYSVVAVDASGNRSPAALLDVTTPPDTTKPSAPTGLATGTVTSTQVQLAWTASTDDVGVAKYRVYRNGALVGESTTTGYTDTTVAASTTYTYTVTAVDAAGNESAPSTGLPVTTAAGPDTTPPTQPAGLAAGSVSASQVQLSWTAATDNVGVAKYRVYRNGVALAEPTTTSYTDSTVVASTTYTYTVSALDAAGNESPQSAPLPVTTPAGGAVLFTDDFETGTLAHWSTSSATVVQSQLVYAGLWAARMTTTSTAAYLSEKLASTYTELTVSARLMLISQGANNITMMKVRTGNAGSVLGVFVTTGGRLSLRNDASGITTNSAVIFTPNVWHEVKLHVIVGTAPLSEVWFDGVKVDALTRTDALGLNLLGWVDAVDKAGSRTYDVAVDNFKVTTP